MAETRATIVPTIFSPASIVNPPAALSRRPNEIFPRVRRDAEPRYMNLLMPFSDPRDNDVSPRAANRWAWLSLLRPRAIPLTPEAVLSK